MTHDLDCSRVTGIPDRRRPAGPTTVWWFRLRLAAILAALIWLLASCGAPSPAPAAAGAGSEDATGATAVVVAPTQPAASMTPVASATRAPSTQIPTATLAAATTLPPAAATKESGAQATSLPSPAPSDTPARTPGVTGTPSPRPSATPTRTSAPTLTPVPTPAWQTRSLLAGPGQPGRLYVLQGDEAWAAFPPERARLLVSDDYGRSWLKFPGGLPAGGCVSNVNLDYAAPDALYASTCNGLYRWSGSDWNLVSAQKTSMVAIVYGQPEVIWATAPFDGGAAVIRSNDGGATWMPAASGLVHFNGVANIGIDPRDANVLYAIIWPKYAGSYLRRGNADGEWQVMPTPNDNSVINTGMTIDGSSGTLYVITVYPGCQLWRSSNPAASNLGDVRWALVHDFGENVEVVVLASGWGSQGVALYVAIRPITPLGNGAIEIGPPVIHRSEDGGQTWTPLPIPNG